MDLQLDTLTNAGVDRERIYKDRASARNGHRPGLENCLKALRPGNMLVVWKLNRLDRDLKHVTSGSCTN